MLMSSLKKTARITGLLYLGVGITGMLGFLLIRPEIYVAGDAAATLANLGEREMLARLGIAFEFLVVLTQALAAVWFYKLFRTVSSTASGSLAAFGLINSTAILSSAAFLVTALAVAFDPALAPGGDAAATVQLMYETSGAFWGVGALFFGLWLIPMGYLVVVSRWMPRPLGWILMAGGVGYILSAFVVYLVPGASGWVELALTIPATAGEFWMIGYLLIKGVRSDMAVPVRTPEPVSV
jgi:Domain of unknown function (DUF4386)